MNFKVGDEVLVNPKNSNGTVIVGIIIKIYKYDMFELAAISIQGHDYIFESYPLSLCFKLTEETLLYEF